MLTALLILGLVALGVFTLWWLFRKPKAAPDYWHMPLPAAARIEKR